jgi:uncharacterized membrane protein YfcA
METFEFIVTLLLLGVGVGMLSAALGIGGGMIMIPAFIQFFPDMDINTAKGTSLMAIFFVASYNSIRMNRGHMKNPWNVIVSIAGGAIIGGFFGGWLTNQMSEIVVTYIFIGLLIFSGFRMFALKEIIIEEEDVRQRKFFPGIIGFCAGTVAGGTGTGGGAIFVPFALWAGIVSNLRVVALSNTVMVLTSIAGLTAHFLASQTSDMPGTIGRVNVSIPPLVVLGAILIAPVGRALNAKLTFNRRRILMGTLLILIAVRLVYRLYFGG